MTDTQPRALTPPSVAAGLADPTRTVVTNKDDVPPEPYVYGSPSAFGGDIYRGASFSFFAIAGGTRRKLDMVEAVTWHDQNVILNGTITIRESAYISYRDQYQLREGDQIVCHSIGHNGVSEELWTMRINSPTLTVSTLQRTAKLVNDMDLLRRSDGTFHYGGLNDPSTVADTKKIKGGYPVAAMIRDIGARFAIPIVIPDGLLKFKLQKFHMPATSGTGASPLDAIRYGLLQERQNVGTRVVMRYEHGALYILPLQRSAALRALGPTLLDAVYTSVLSEDFASEVIVRGTGQIAPAPDKPKKRKKATTNKNYVIRQSQSSISRYGFIHKQYWSPDAQTDGDLAEEADQLLAWLAKPRKDLQLTLPGVPGIRRGDAIQVALGPELNQVVYVTEISHDLRPGMYQQTLTVTFDDPYIDQRGHDILWRLKASQDEAEAQRKSDEQRKYLGASPKADRPDSFYGDQPTVIPDSPTYMQ